MKVILRADKVDDFVLALRAAQWLLRQPMSQKEAVIAYGDTDPKPTFYVNRLKDGVSCRPCD